jgi:predicted XRE-type DNA-binding protein
MRTNTIESFWERVVVRGPDECWPWKLYCNRCGYGVFGYHGKIYLSHRFAYIATCGDIPNGMHVLHRCDNPPCCNPKHLWLGTHLENMEDMTRKRRYNDTAREKNGRHKLTEEQVAEIRRLHKTGLLQKDIAKQFSISQSNVSDIILYQRWKTV